MIEAQQALLDALHRAVDQMAAGHGLTLAFESPKQAAHGDLAITLAMQLARALKKNPREVAAQLVAALEAQPET